MLYIGVEVIQQARCVNSSERKALTTFHLTLILFYVGPNPLTVMFIY